MFRYDLQPQHSDMSANKKEIEKEEECFGRLTKHHVPQNSLELFLDRKLIALPKSPHPVSSLWFVFVDSVALVAIFAPDNFSILQKSKLRLIQLTILTKTLVTRCFLALVITGIKPLVFQFGKTLILSVSKQPSLVTKFYIH